VRPGELFGQTGKCVSAKCGYYQLAFASGKLAHFRGRELVCLGPLPAGVTGAPARSRPQARPMVSGEPAQPSAEAEASEGQERRQWWAQQSRGADYTRKRKPSQHQEVISPTENSLPPRQIGNGGLVVNGMHGFSGFVGGNSRTAYSADGVGLVVGSRVIIIKPGNRQGAAGSILSMHNGYFQVQTEMGDVLNMRGKELQSAQPEAGRLNPGGCIANSAGTPKPDAVPPTLPAQPTSAMLRPPTTGRARTMTDLTIGNTVAVRRPGDSYGMVGKVIASRNGYLVVQLGTRTSYFRARDLQKVRPGTTEVPGLTPSPKLPLGATTTVGESASDVQGASVIRAPAARRPAPKPKQPRISWRDMGNEADEAPVAAHEHQYGRAIKTEPHAMADVIDRVETLLVLYPPYESSSPAPPDFRGESIRMAYTLKSERAKLPDAAMHRSVVDELAEFQERWRRGEPVLIGGIDAEFKLKWGPHGFLERFGAEQVNMIDCRDGKAVHWLTLAHFFAGYMKPWTRAKCPDTFRRMMLKLKDWPPNQDFRDKMPEYYEDLMQALPFPQYTHREGVLNLSKYFPGNHVPPDLGPKMYNAFGLRHAWRGMDPTTAKGGHTNLHCDISDAVNVMVDVYAGEDDADSEEEVEDLELHDDELGDLSAQYGAIWDIYRWEDTDAILQLLHQVAAERDVEITNNPIHDQLFYLDETLRRRLREQYNVRGWRVVQKHGDAIFIPAGCPHQVRNLTSCVKVALDFVSPENAHRCVGLTDEFAKLPRGHHFSEDKLQVKTMLLHAIGHITEALLPEAAPSASAGKDACTLPPTTAHPHIEAKEKQNEAAALY